VVVVQARRRHNDDRIDPGDLEQGIDVVDQGTGRLAGRRQLRPVPGIDGGRDQLRAIDDPREAAPRETRPSVRGR
jgi:hypothetical protein